MKTLHEQFEDAMHAKYPTDSKYHCTGDKYTVDCLNDLFEGFQLGYAQAIENAATAINKALEILEDCGKESEMKHGKIAGLKFAADTVRALQPKEQK